MQTNKAKQSDIGQFILWSLSLFKMTSGLPCLVFLSAFSPCTDQCRSPVRCEVSRCQHVLAGPGNSEELGGTSSPHLQPLPVQSDSGQKLPAWRGLT